MLLFKILGIGDLLAMLSIWIAPMVPEKFILLTAIYLLGKGGIFAIGGDFASYIDVVCGLYILGIIFGIGNVIVSTLISLYLLQKGIYSLF
jgi:hypothetical protein